MERSRRCARQDRELALAAQGFVVLDPDVRRAFPDAGAVNRALRGLLEIAKNANE